MEKTNNIIETKSSNENTKEILAKYETIITAMEELQKFIPAQRKEIDNNIEEKTNAALLAIKDEKKSVVTEINRTRKENLEKMALAKEEIINQIYGRLKKDYETQFNKITDSVKLIERKINDKSKMPKQPETPIVEKYTKSTTKNQVLESDKLLDMIRSDNIQFVDKRSKGGCLWIIGGEKLKPFVDKYEALLGAHFSFSPNGGAATEHKESWFTIFKD